jgi:hypothetical protein
MAFVGLLFALTLATPFLPPPRDGIQFAWQALAGYFALAALAGWLDRGPRLRALDSRPFSLGVVVDRQASSCIMRVQGLET